MPLFRPPSRGWWILALLGAGCPIVPNPFALEAFPCDADTDCAANLEYRCVEGTCRVVGEPGDAEATDGGFAADGGSATDGGAIGGDGDGDGDGETPDGGADGGSPSDAGGIAGDGDGDGDGEATDGGSLSDAGGIGGDGDAGAGMDAGPPVCGNGEVEPPEVCDDGNDAGGDYCAPSCLSVTGFCGDLIVQANELCDDGSPDGDDYCGEACRAVTGSCGDGIVQADVERCDDDAGCALDCQGSAASCGDGVLDPGEACDDNNTDLGDGCDAFCRQEVGFVCAGGACAPWCGDGVPVGGEACDDGNDAGADGCFQCQLEGPSLCLPSTVPLNPNPDFDLGNQGFSSEYTFVTPATSALNPEGVFVITDDPTSPLLHGHFSNLADNQPWTDVSPAGDGAAAFFNGEAGPLVWSFTGTSVVGVPYLVTVWARSWGDINHAELRIVVDGQPVGERLVTAPGEWRRLSATVWGGFSTVTLEDETAAGGGNDFAIDAVSIVALDGSVAEGCF